MYNLLKKKKQWKPNVRISHLYNRNLENQYYVFQFVTCQQLCLLAKWNLKTDFIFVKEKVFFEIL